MLSVGVSSSIDESEGMGISSSPNALNYWFVSDFQNLGYFVHSVVSQMRTQAAVSTSTGSSTGTYYGFIDRGSRFGTALGFSSSGTSSGTDSGSTDSGSSSSGTSSGIDFGSTGTRERPEFTAGGGDQRFLGGTTFFYRPLTKGVPRIFWPMARGGPRKNVTPSEGGPGFFLHHT